MCPPGPFSLNTKKGKTMNRILNLVLSILIGLVVFAVGIFNIVTGIKQIHKQKSGKYVETQAVITKIEMVEVSDDDAPGGYREEYELTAEYTAGGKKVVAVLNENPKDYYEGMELTICYNVDNPLDNILPGSKGGAIMIAVGVVSILIGAAVFIKNLIGR